MAAREGLERLRGISRNTHLIEENQSAGQRHALIAVHERLILSEMEDIGRGKVEGIRTFDLRR